MHLHLDIPTDRHTNRPTYQQTDIPTDWHINIPTDQHTMWFLYTFRKQELFLQVDIDFSLRTLYRIQVISKLEIIAPTLLTTIAVNLLSSLRFTTLALSSNQTPAVSMLSLAVFRAFTQSSLLYPNSCSCSICFSGRG